MGGGGQNGGHLGPVEKRGGDRIVTLNETGGEGEREPRDVGALRNHTDANGAGSGSRSRPPLPGAPPPSPVGIGGAAEAPPGAPQVSNFSSFLPPLPALPALPPLLPEPPRCCPCSGPGCCCCCRYGEPATPARESRDHRGAGRGERRYRAGGRLPGKEGAVFGFWGVEDESEGSWMGSVLGGAANWGALWQSRKERTVLGGGVVVVG